MAMTDQLDVTIRPLAATDWPAITTLFGASGACGGCWCMYWRASRGGKTWTSQLGAPNRTQFQVLVETGKVHGVLGFAGDQPIGWCNIEPRTDLPRLATVKQLQRPVETHPWSIACLFIRRGWRRKGVATALVRAATTHAVTLGATEIEAYPINTPPRRRRQHARCLRLDRDRTDLRGVRLPAAGSGQGDAGDLPIRR
jgi:GNAT superfamily N-acetyltransferase